MPFCYECCNNCLLTYRITNQQRMTQQQDRRGTVTPVVNDNTAVQSAIKSAIKALKAILPIGSTRHSQDDLNKKFILACISILDGKTEYNVAPICRHPIKLSISTIPDIPFRGKFSSWNFRSMVIDCTTQRNINGSEMQYPLQASEVFDIGISTVDIFI